MDIKIEFDEKLFCYSVSFKKLNNEILLEMIRFTRIVKQLEVNFIVLIFETNLKKIIKPMTVLDRLNWSKLGQKFTNLLENLSIPSVSIIKDTCFNEYLK